MMCLRRLFCTSKKHVLCGQTSAGSSVLSLKTMFQLHLATNAGDHTQLEAETQNDGILCILGIFRGICMLAFHLV